MGAELESSWLQPVLVVASAAKPRWSVSNGAGDEALPEIALPSGVRVRFPASIDRGHLRELAAAL